LVFAGDTEMFDQRFDFPVGSGRADLTIDRIPFLDGTYTLAIDLKSRLGMVFDRREMVKFEMLNPGRSRGNVSLDLRVELRTASLS
jgi:hypothetical protein